MALSDFLMNTVRSVFAGKAVGSAPLGICKFDVGMAEVSLMVAGLDGAILPQEMDAFEAMLKQCRGYSPTMGKPVMSMAMHRLGYVLALAQSGRYSEQERLMAFVDDAEMALPRGFADAKSEDVRRAFVMWMAMGMSDGDFSSIERNAILLLKDRFVDVKRAHAFSDAAALGVIGRSFSTLGSAASFDPVVPPVRFLEEDFFEKAEILLQDVHSPTRDRRLEQFVKQEF